MESRLTNWLLAQRSSPRLAFLLQIACRALTSICSLLWVPLLLRSMGQALNGLLLTFQSITSMGGLGDLGMGGLVSIQTSRMLGQGKEEEMRKFLAAARAFFAIMALLGRSGQTRRWSGSRRPRAPKRGGHRWHPSAASFPG